MKVGFTGTSQGMSRAQATQAVEFASDEDELHHGDCVGADEEVHILIRGGIGVIVVHPPDDDKARAFTNRGAQLTRLEVRDPLPYLKRNHAIVDETDILLAAPAGPEESWPRSGTWATIRYALKQGKPVFIVMPNGSIG